MKRRVLPKSIINALIHIQDVQRAAYLFAIVVIFFLELCLLFLLSMSSLRSVIASSIGSILNLLSSIKQNSGSLVPTSSQLKVDGENREWLQYCLSNSTQLIPIHGIILIVLVSNNQLQVSESLLEEVNLEIEESPVRI